MSASLHASSPSAPLPTGPVADSPNRTATIALACLGVFVSYLPVVGVSSALPVIQEATDASTVGLQWITDAFILPTAALLLTFGVVGDLYGRKKIYLSGLCLTVLGSLIAHSVVQICIGQARIGIGTAALLPSTLGLIAHVCPDHHVRARAIAAWTASLGLGLTLGPLINGQILNHVGWRWIFPPTLVLGAVIAAAGAFALTDSRSDRERHLDIPGQVLAIIGIAVNSLPRRLAGTAGAANSALRQIGTQRLRPWARPAESRPRSENRGRSARSTAVRNVRGLYFGDYQDD
jgi:MFS family permease